MYTNKEVGELLGSVFMSLAKFAITCGKFYIAYHFVVKYW
jgi:hypothetical protein